MKENDSIRLNEQQKQAVRHNKGPLLIIAGAGTGKTSVLVEKIKYLIEKKLAKPEEILALTFTEKAAHEMEERVDSAIPYGYFQMWISTFHAFADHILKQEASHIGISPNFHIMTDAESILFLKKNLFLFDIHYFRPLGNPNKFLEALIFHFSRLKDEDIDPETYIQWTKTTEDKMKYEELSQVYIQYEKLKRKENVMDFSDLVFYLVRLFRRRTAIHKRYQKMYKYILIDEFQDTNITQYELIKLLCPAKRKPNLTVVGDDSQAIYKFRGASVSNILNFMHDYPKAKQIMLKYNYRSNQSILDHAYQLIQHNNPDTLESKLGISKELIAQKKEKDPAVSFFLAEQEEEEADRVTKKILELKNIYHYSDFALLVRAHNHSQAFVRAFARFGIPYQFFGKGALFKKPEIKELIAYLKFLYDPDDSASFYRVLVINIFSLNAKDISLLTSFSKKISQSLYQSLEIYLSFYDSKLARKEFEIYKKYLPLLKEETRSKLLTLFSMTECHFKLLKKESAGQILYFFLENTGYLRALVSYKNERDEAKALNISKFFDMLKAFEIEHEDASVQAMVEYIEMNMEVGESPTSIQVDSDSYDAVNIITVHGAKGLEFPVVFLVSLTQGRFPTYEKNETIPIPESLMKEILPEGNYHEQEERRLFYVALTRAKDLVFLSASKFYTGGKRERKISLFVQQTLGTNYLEKIIAAKKSSQAQLSMFDYEKKPETFIKKKLQRANYSYSQLEMFQKCPLQYYYMHIIKIPTSPSFAASFGTSIHQTLQAFYAQYQTNKKIDEANLLSLYAEQWIPVGYNSPIHEQRMKVEGKRMLHKFYQRHHNSNLNILALENQFKLKLDNYTIRGKIDRIDEKKNGVIEVIDYKTGKKPSDKEISKNLQLSLYALAATSSSFFHKNPDKIFLTFYYLQTNEKITYRRTPEEISVVKENVLKIISEIQKNIFPPQPGLQCKFCPFRIICDAWQ
jgi:DNA helicase-2/ATP-dependent DNA helicase PcrA